VRVRAYVCVILDISNTGHDIQTHRHDTGQRDLSITFLRECGCEYVGMQVFCYS